MQFDFHDLLNFSDNSFFLSFFLSVCTFILHHFILIFQFLFFCAFGDLLFNLCLTLLFMSLHFLINFLIFLFQLSVYIFFVFMFSFYLLSLGSPILLYFFMFYSLFLTLSLYFITFLLLFFCYSQFDS